MRDVLVALAVFSADLITKQRYFFADDTSSAFSFFGGFVQNVRHENFGLIADLPVPLPLIVMVSVAVIALASHGFWRAWKKGRRIEALTLAVLLGGAFGNLYDRLTFGFVRDWILLANTSALNLADIAIFTGILGWFFASRRNIHTQTP